MYIGSPKRLLLPPSLYTYIDQRSGLYGLDELISSRQIYHVLIHQDITISPALQPWSRTITRISRSTPVMIAIVLGLLNCQDLSSGISSVKLRCSQCHHYKRDFIDWPRNLNLAQVHHYLNNIPITRIRVISRDDLKTFPGTISFRLYVVRKHPSGSDPILLKLLYPNTTFISGDESFELCMTELRLESPSPIKLGYICRTQTDPFSVTFEEHNKLQFVRNVEYFTFLSCGEVVPSGISFTGFISAFDVPTWILLWLSLVGGNAICLYCMRPRCPRMFWEASFGALKMFLEQGDPLPSFRGKRAASYSILGAVLLTGVIVTNHYKGDNISNLSAPREFHPPETFENLMVEGYRIYSRILPFLKQSISETYSLAGLQSPDMDGYTEISQMAYNVRTLSADVEHNIVQNTRYHPNETREIGAKIFNFSFSGVIQVCDKVALTGWHTDLTMVQNKVKNTTGWMRRHHFLVIGNGNLYYRRNGWNIAGWNNPNIFRKLAALHESGISNEWKEAESWGGMDYNIVERMEAVPLQLRDNTVTIFFVFLIGCGFGVGVFLVEGGNIKKIGNSLVMTGYKIYGVLSSWRALLSFAWITRF